MLTHFVEHGVLLQVVKCDLGNSVIEFNRHVISGQGIKPLVFNVEAIVNAPRPENVKQLQSYLGAVNYYLKFNPMLSDVTEPLRNLLHNNVQ